MNTSVIQEQNGGFFASDGAAWQWLIDNTPIQSEQLIKFAKKLNCSDFEAIYAIRRIYENGQTIEQITKKMDEVAEQQAADALEQYKQITAAYNLQAFVNGITESVNTPVFSTGFEALDKAIDGGLYEGLYIIGAIPSLGKTTFVMQIADNLAMQGQDVLIVSLEMSRNDLIAKSISRKTIDLVMDNVGHGTAKDAKTARGITDGARYAHYTDQEQKLIDAAIEQYAAFANHLFILEGVGDISVKEIRAAAEQHKKLTGKTPVVVIDYLQILYPYDVKASDKQNTDKAVLELRRLARDAKTPVIAISSFSRANYNTPVNMAAFKESGGIEYSSDVLIGMQLAGVGTQGFDANTAKKANPRNIEAVILKARLAPVGSKIKYEYHAAFNRFREIGITEDED